MFKVNNRDARATSMTSFWRRSSVCDVNFEHWRLSGVFSVNSEHISYLFLVFLLLTLKIKVFDGQSWTQYSTDTLE